MPRLDKTQRKDESLGLTPQRIRQTSGTLGWATRVVIERLAQAKPGDEIIYIELNGLTGINVQIQRYVLNTARRYLRDNNNMVFDVEPNIGLVCLPNEGRLGRGHKRLQFVHNYAKNTVKELQTVDPVGLTPLQKHCLLAELSIAGAVTLMTHEKATQRLEAQTTPQQITINLEDYRDLFRGV